MDPCITCHNPHDPAPPETPQECRACHEKVARTKAVSHHVKLDCITCHTADEGHRLSPRVHSATKPARREFCGSCHGEASDVKGTPKVDLSTHGDRYLCWQCHYPHLPEG
jgi:ribosomal protein S27AE